jgi:hypothetical protein
MVDEDDLIACFIDIHDKNLDENIAVVIDMTAAKMGCSADQVREAVLVWLSDEDEDD